MPVNVAIIGLGHGGREYAAALATFDPAVARLVATCDPAADAMSDKIPHSTDAHTLLADSRIDAVIIATPTDSLATLAAGALAAGKDVLIESPIAHVTEPLKALAAAARSANRLLVPALWLRAEPAIDWLIGAIRSDNFGRLRSLDLEHHRPRPDRAAWYAIERISGGAWINVHCDSVDLVCQCVGRPAAVTSTGGPDRIHTAYHYDDDDSAVNVSATSAWSVDDTSPRLRFSADFETGAVVFSSDKPSRLNLSTGGKMREIALPTADVPAKMLRDFFARRRDRDASGDAFTHPTIDDAIDVTILLETEQYAAESGRRVQIMWGVAEPDGH